MKLWEALKALDEDRNKKFVHLGLSNSYLGDCEVNGGIANFKFEEKWMNAHYDDWKEVEQSVTWQEAIEAWVTGKNIYFKEGTSIYRFRHSQFCFESEGVLNRADFKIAKWFIGDPS